MNRTAKRHSITFNGHPRFIFDLLNYFLVAAVIIKQVYRKATFPSCILNKQVYLRNSSYGMFYR